MINLIFKLLFAHFLADVALQSTYTATAKHKSKLFLFAHSFIYGGVIYYICGEILFVGLLALATHYIIDELKIEKKISMMTDQILHLTVLLLIWGIICLKLLSLMLMAF